MRSRDTLFSMYTQFRVCRNRYTVNVHECLVSKNANQTAVTPNTDWAKMRVLSENVDLLFQDGMLVEALGSIWEISA